MSTIWKNWCRLCAKQECNENNAFFKLETIMELSVLVQKYFLLSISPYDESPTSICNECVHFVLKLEKFAVRCIKVDKMYSELVYENINISQNEVHAVRYKYGLDEEEKFINVMPSASKNQSQLLNNFIKPIDLEHFKVDQSTDTSDLLNEFVNIKKEINFALDAVPTNYAAIKKKRGRPSKKEKNTNANISNESVDETSFTEVNATYLDEIEPDDDDGDDVIDDEDDDECDIDDLSVENDLEIKEIQEELRELQENDEENSPSGSTSKKKYAKNKDLELYTCTICDRIFTRLRQYEYHMRTKHSKDDLPYVCSKCPKRFTTEKKVKLHERVHLPESLKLIHPCPCCDKKFSKAVNVQAHIKAIHVGDRPFICEECGKSFGTKGALKEHQITHSEERPYQCAHCPKKFKNLPRLKTHEDIHNATVYVCPHCGLQLNTKRTLKMHMVVHSDQKKYKCQFCGNEYKRSKALKNHLILHTGLRPYLCPFCDKTFANGSNCRSHKKKSHPLELAQMEASGEVHRATNIPKLEHLQPKKHQLQQIQDIIDSSHNTVPKLEEFEIKTDPIIMDAAMSSSSHDNLTNFGGVSINTDSKQSLLLDVHNSGLQRMSTHPATLTLIPTTNL